MNALRALLLAVAATAALYFIPALAPLARPLVLFATLMHELGHGLAALLLGGSFTKLQLWADGSGVAMHAGSNGAFGRAFISAAGPLGPPFAALALFFAARTDRGAHRALAALAFFLLLVDVVWTRNLFGMFFVGAVALALGALAKYGSAKVAQVACAFLAVQLSLSAFSRSDYLFTAVAQTGAGAMPSDTAQIADALWLPYWIWGALIAVISLAVLGAGLWLFARAIAPDSPGEVPSIP